MGNVRLVPGFSTESGIGKSIEGDFNAIVSTTRPCGCGRRSRGDRHRRAERASLGANRVLRVIGANVVFVYDGRITHTNAAAAGDDDALAVTDSLVHVLPEGYMFDMETKRPKKPDGTEISKRAD